MIPEEVKIGDEIIFLYDSKPVRGVVVEKIFIHSLREYSLRVDGIFIGYNDFKPNDFKGINVFLRNGILFDQKTWEQVIFLWKKYVELYEQTNDIYSKISSITHHGIGVIR